jgi:Mg2+/Co2+ transporter CorB
MLQAGTPSLTGGGVLAVVVTLLLTWLFYAVTLHLAATFFIGDTPTQLAAKAAIVPAIVSMLLQQWGVSSGLVSPSLGVLVVIAATLVADGIAISLSYRLSTSSTAPLVALHLAFAAVLGFALNNIFDLV